MDCSPPGFSVSGILQARILEWVAILFCRVSSWPRDWTRVSCTVGWVHYAEPQKHLRCFINKKPNNYASASDLTQSVWSPGSDGGLSPSVCVTMPSPGTVVWGLGPGEPFLWLSQFPRILWNSFSDTVFRVSFPGWLLAFLFSWDLDEVCSN